MDSGGEMKPYGSLAKIEEGKAVTFQTWTPKKPYRHMTEVHSNGNIDYYVDSIKVRKDIYDAAWN